MISRAWIVLSGWLCLVLPSLNAAIDYPATIQPILDRHCVHCHGGEDGIAGGLDYSAGWTWAFNISYETFLKNGLTGLAKEVKDTEKAPGNQPGSAVAPLANELLSGHHGRIRGLSNKERDLLLAWVDGNCNYHGTFERTAYATCDALLAARAPLLAEMEKSGCTRCHEKEIGNDWVNLSAPLYSRILRAPLAKGDGSLAWCRDRTARAVRVPLARRDKLTPQALKPLREYAPSRQGETVTTFADTSARGYRAMLAIIEDARGAALKEPRIDMPGAVVLPRKSGEH